MSVVADELCVSGAIGILALLLAVVGVFL
ncbi:MAG: hypothetical protein LZF86_190570 [Nitrospira sp.]|nr:MAG: hypothetical protein LZF86_190570 [Nitrospira sp.]